MKKLLIAMLLVGSVSYAGFNPIYTLNQYQELGSEVTAITATANVLTATTQWQSINLPTPNNYTKVIELECWQTGWYNWTLKDDTTVKVNTGNITGRNQRKLIDGLLGGILIYPPSNAVSLNILLDTATTNVITKYLGVDLKSH
jgi:hypothetical protein